MEFGKEKSTYWGCALGGETGEALNIIKKYARGDYADKYDDFLNDLSKELADVFLYLVLASRHFGIDFQDAILNKINEIYVRKYPCIGCNGTGLIVESPREVAREVEKLYGSWQKEVVSGIEKCPKCDGKGFDQQKVDEHLKNDREKRGE